VGIDGDGSTSVEQTGSEVDCFLGTPIYYGWYEMYPAPSVSFSNPVQAGDHFTASVTDGSTTSFTLTLTDVTQGWTRTEHKTTKKPRALHSAEVIAEAPCCTSGGGILPLTDFGKVTFTKAMANGSALGNFSPQEITMVRSGGAVKAKPSALTAGENFSINWRRH
jgi:hypothetical protein